MPKDHKIKVSTKGKCSVSLYCRMCGDHYELTGLGSSELDRLYNRFETKELIQDIIPEVPAKWKDLLISHICPTCVD